MQKWVEEENFIRINFFYTNILYDFGNIYRNVYLPYFDK